MSDASEKFLESPVPERTPTAEPVERMAIDYVRDLFGSVKGAPSDLATNPEYMRGFGE